MILGLIFRTYQGQQTKKGGDPLLLARPELGLDGTQLQELEEEVAREVREAIELARRPAE